MIERAQVCQSGGSVDRCPDRLVFFGQNDVECARCRVRLLREEKAPKGLQYNRLRPRCGEPKGNLSDGHRGCLIETRPGRDVFGNKKVVTGTFILPILSPCGDVLHPQPRSAVFTKPHKAVLARDGFFYARSFSHRWGTDAHR